MINKKWIRTFSKIAFVIYMIVLVYFLLLSDGFGRTVRHDSFHYNLIPFTEIIRFVKYRDYIGYDNVMLNLLGNVIAFVPFGALVRFVMNRSVRCYEVVFLTFCFSLSVELLQLVAKVGSFDVDDLILNTLGGLIGYIIYIVLKKIDQVSDSLQRKRG